MHGTSGDGAFAANRVPAQIDMARFRQPIDDAANAQVIAALDHVNATAEAQPGFVPRLKGDGSDATGLKPSADPEVIVNMSLSRDAGALAAVTVVLFDDLWSRALGWIG